MNSPLFEFMNELAISRIRKRFIVAIAGHAHCAWPMMHTHTFACLAACARAGLTLGSRLQNIWGGATAPKAPRFRRLCNIIFCPKGVQTRGSTVTKWEANTYTCTCTSCKTVWERIHGWAIRVAKRVLFIEVSPYIKESLVRGSTPAQGSGVYIKISYLDLVYWTRVLLRC